MSDGATLETGPAVPRARLRVWDAPVRLFHWALVLLIGAAWWTAEERMLDWHRLAGYSILTLIAFRLLWGVVGSTTARFSSFVRGPMTLVRYVATEMLDRAAPARVGHNPLGGWSVVVMLTLLFAQTLLGLFAVDIDGLESGPFSYLVDFDLGRAAAELHETLFNIILAVIGLHVAAIVFHLLVHRDDLVGPMITGRRRAEALGVEPRFVSPFVALALLGTCAAGVWAAVKFLGQAY